MSSNDTVENKETCNTESGKKSLQSMYLIKDLHPERTKAEASIQRKETTQFFKWAKHTLHSKRCVEA